MLLVINLLQSLAAVAFAWTLSSALADNGSVALAIGSLGLRWGLGRLETWVASDLGQCVEQDSIAQLSTQVLSGHEPWRHPERAADIQQFSERRGRFAAGAQWLSRALIPSIAIVLVAQATAAPYLAGLMLLSMPLIPTFLVLIGSRTQREADQQVERLTALSGQVMERLRGLTALWVQGTTEAACQDIARASEQHRAATHRVLRVAFLSNAAIDLAASLAVALVAVHVGTALLDLVSFGGLGELTLQSGMFVLMLAPEVFLPWRRLTAAWHDRSQANAAERAIAAWPSNTKGSAAPPPGLRIQGRSIAPGARVWIRGPSGAGKSQLLEALAGLTHHDEHRCGERIGWVDQHPAISSNSLRQQARALDSHWDDQTWLSMLEQLELHQRIRTLDEPINPLGLSGGEHQRLALLRALSREPSVLLMDEPTASLDADNAALFWATLADFTGTCVIASHDDLGAWATDEVCL